jgi:hypothetical protein
MEFMERLRDMVHLDLLLLLNVKSSRASHVSAATVHNYLMKLSLGITLINLLNYSRTILAGRLCGGNHLVMSLISAVFPTLLSYSGRIATFYFSF